ncbi:hypothetical protein N7462_007802 [Penicillium macrosclerotiorum]|uniref:uncharacterized protein n=1 Tax=Penicillium macrosclerotiorum TaxID=303699 RepID=UPI002546EEE2|nr:uncharacterized protein N7462_007802 [Penicillium macrosclerotiorum]KAJ5679558.1 hypothetical protein N7462_007802 [Penicillium macrosclerotiorum]
MQIINRIVRFFQMVFSGVVLGLSINLARNQYYGKVPSQTSYAAFTGALGIIAGIIGFVALIFSGLGEMVSIVVDGVTSAALLIGGIVYAVALRGTNCNDTSTDGNTWDNPLISGGCYTDDDGKHCFDKYVVHSRCVRAQTDCAFMFITCLVCLGAIATSIIARRR